MSTINEKLDALTALVVGALDPKWTTVYDYRTAPEKHLRYGAVTHMGTEDGRRTTAGGDQRVDFLIVLFAKHDKTESGKRTAERDLNDAEDAILKTVTETRDNGYWLKAVIPFPTIRPRQPRALPETRLAEIPVRLLT